eukprot:1478764-Pyramimonas_sp.AAC.1
MLCVASRRRHMRDTSIVRVSSTGELRWAMQERRPLRAQILGRQVGVISAGGRPRRNERAFQPFG